MSVQKQNLVQYYSGPIAINTVLPITEFTFMDNSHVNLKIRGLNSNWEYGVDYIVSGANSLLRTVTLLKTVAESDILAVFLDVPITQGVSPEEGGSFPAAIQEFTLDKLTYIAQVLSEKNKRTFQSSIDTEFNGVLYNIGDNANKAIKINSTGDALEFSEYDPDTLQTAAASSATAAAGSATAAATSAEIASIEAAKLTNLKIVNVRDYRLAPDTDWTNAIQRACDVADNGIIFFPIRKDEDVSEYEISNTINFKPGHKFIGASRSGVTITMTDDTKYAFSYLSPLAESAYDIDAGLVFESLTINAKNAINLNQSGTYSTVFSKQAHIKGCIFNNLKISGKYSSSVDSNYNTSAIPTQAELDDYGIGIRASKIFNSVISNCQIQYYGTGIRFDGCDINKIDNCRLATNARHIYFYDHNTYGHQNKILNSDILYNTRYGGIYLQNSMFTQIEGNYFEHYQPSACFVMSQYDVGTLISNNRFDDTLQTTTPFMDLQPWYDCIICNNRWNPNTNLQSFLVRDVTSGYDGVHNQRIKYYGNSYFMPKPTNLPGVFINEIEPYLFRYDNYNSKFRYAIVVPFVWDTSLKTYLTAASTGSDNPSIYFPILSTTHTAFKIRVSARHVTGAEGTGYFIVNYIRKSDKVSTSLFAAYLGLVSNTDLEMKEVVVTLPVASEIVGDIQVLFADNEMQVASIELIPFYETFEASTSNIKMNGTVALGTRNTVPRADHVHPTDTSRAADADVVHLSTNETISGAKNFTASSHKINGCTLNFSNTYNIAATTNKDYIITLPATSCGGFINVKYTGLYNGGVGANFIYRETNYVMYLLNNTVSPNIRTLKEEQGGTTQLAGLTDSLVAVGSSNQLRLRFANSSGVVYNFQVNIEMTITQNSTNLTIA